MPESGQYTLQQLVPGYRCGAVEVIFAEALAPLGMATQHRWSATVLARMTLALLSGSILTTSLAAPLLERRWTAVPQTTCYAKPLPTLADALALG
jgi:hypothetical protein